MIKKLLLSLMLVLSLLALSGGGFAELTRAADDDDEEENNPVVQPTIPVPDFLPTPDVGIDGAETQNYILNETIPRAINIGIAILAMTAFVGILIASIQMLTAYGNDDKINRAKTNLRYSLFGLTVVMLSYGIVSIVISVALPNEEDSQRTWIPRTYAVDVDDDVDILLPSQQEIIEAQDEQNRVSLPGGNFFGEIVPAAITNMMYLVGFLVFIAFMYGGTLLVIGRGNEESVTKAKNILIYAAVALALVGLGFALVYGIVTLNLTQNEDSTADDVFSDEESTND